MFVEAAGVRTHPVDLQAVSSLKIRLAEENALYRCVASNKLGKDQLNIFFHVTRECLVPSGVWSLGSGVWSLASGVRGRASGAWRVVGGVRRHGVGVLLAAHRCLSPVVSRLPAV